MEKNESSGRGHGQDTVEQPQSSAGLDIKSIVAIAIALVETLLEYSLSFFIARMAVQGLWVSLEISYYGVIQHRAVDDIIGLILTVSLVANYWYMRKRHKSGGAGGAI